jgi:hypothetical protein|uniref:Uncharacterized protein n=1 Tax=viral metagenome TaxID=1070528 RepID=A0A6C0LI16_9ZZZZ
MNYITIVYENKLYKIEKEPFETDENTYIRGWYIIKNNHLDNIISRSIIYLNERTMKY